MAKDPAVLFFIDKWLLATKEMKPDCKCWYHSLILHQFDKKSLPNDIEELANLADVRVSEFERFKQVFEEVLKHKFKENEEGRLVNEFANEIVKGREQFKEKRANAGKMSYFARFMRKICNDENVIQYVLKHTDFETLDTKNQQMLEQVFKQKGELYIDVNVNVNKTTYTNIDSNSKLGDFEEIEIEPVDAELLFESQSELINLLITSYGFDEEKYILNKKTIFAFVTTQLKTQLEIDHFANQYQNYKEYKKMSGEKEHNFIGFFGTQAMRFKNSAWNSENWALKIEQYKSNSKNQTKFEKLKDAFNAPNPYRKNE